MYDINGWLAGQGSIGRSCINSTESQVAGLSYRDESKTTEAAP